MKPNDGRVSRRALLTHFAMGVGASRLAALASGLSTAFLAGREASADQSPTATYLILNAASSGDPLNVSAPGSMVGALEAAWQGSHDVSLAPSDVTLGNTSARAARPWSLLASDLRSRLGFLHHRTGAETHTEFDRVLTLFDAVKGPAGNGVDSLPSAIAHELAAKLGTVQREPMTLGAERVAVQGRWVEQTTPQDLKALFGGATGSLATFKSLRDKTLDKVYADLKQSGTSAQKRYLEQFANSRAQADRVGSQLYTLLARVPFVYAETLVPEVPFSDDYEMSAADQIVTAVALLKLNVTPVVMIHLPFGGDNHHDAGFAAESLETNGGIAMMQLVWNELKAAGLADLTTFASLNTFGRTFKGNDGRAHNGAHHVMPMFGPAIRAGVAGGPVATGSDYGAGAFDAASGGVGANANVTAAQSLAAAGRTLMRACGVDPVRIDVRIPGAPDVTRLLV